VQVLKLAIEGILATFRAVTATLGLKAQFMEDRNPAYGHKSTTNPCAV
jgi:hypothetical protein